MERRSSSVAIRKSEEFIWGKVFRWFNETGFKVSKVSEFRNLPLHGLSVKLKTLKH
jgi:hypothetical protein